MIPREKLIIIWGKENLMGSYLRDLLAQLDKWHVSSISTNDEMGTLLKSTDPARMDITIIIQGCNPTEMEISMLLLQEYPNIKVIWISLENNLMEIFRKEKMWIEKPVDLVGII